MKQKRKLGIMLVGVSFILLSVFYVFLPEFRYGINELSNLDGKYCKIMSFDYPAKPEEVYRVPLDVYVVNSPSNTVDLSDKEIRDIISGASKIWEKYGIRLSLYGMVWHPEVKWSDDDVLIGKSGDYLQDAIALGNKVIGNKIYNENFNVIKVFFIPSIYNLASAGTPPTGLGVNKHGISAIYIGDDRNMSWTLAHELGHVLNLAGFNEEEGRFNLMTDGGCIKENHYPTIINPEQYASVIEKLKTLRHFTS